MFLTQNLVFLRLNLVFLRPKLVFLTSNLVFLMQKSSVSGPTSEALDSVSETLISAPAQGLGSGVDQNQRF